MFAVASLLAKTPTEWLAEKFTSIVQFYNDPLAVFVLGLLVLCLFFWYFATDFERRKRNIGSALMLLVCTLCVFSVFPIHERLKGGIDIVGGSSFLLRVQPGENGPVTAEQTEQARKVVEERLNGMGNQEPLFARRGIDCLLVQMPGIDTETSEKVRAKLEQVAKLELREVHPQSDMLAAQVESGAHIEPGYSIFKFADKDGGGVERGILLKDRAALGGKQVKRADPSLQQNGAVDVKLNKEGGERMFALTKNMHHGVDRIAIILDGKVLNAPRVNDTLSESFIITGLTAPGEATELAHALMNPLENPLKVESYSAVSPTAGAAVVKQGIVAGIIGLAITFLFVLAYYHLAGVVALIGLIVNTVILFGVMAMFGFTFSLPGIAGMILTIGMAVDANVLIYERLREEIEAGKSLKAAISASYDKAFSAIIDANVTSLITAVILFWLASSTVKGFAITLTIGIAASLFSAILVTRVLFRWGTDLNLLKKLTFLNLIKSSNFDFMGKAKACAVVSSILLAISFAAFVWKKDKALGVDFNGGTMISFQLGKEVQIPQTAVEEKLAGLKNSNQIKSNAFPQNESNPVTGSKLTVRCDTQDAATIETTLRESFPALGEKVGDKYKISSSKDEVSALIGKDAIVDSLLALSLGIIGIMIYITIRFEFSFALGAFVALMHDVLISLGIVVLAGSELSLIHVGAILTIAGYSINDTVVVFDRIRENMKYGSGELKDIMNEAINATLSRTLLTSVTTIVTVAILSFFGGSQLRDFSVMILAGLLIGTYSSIFVASPMVLWCSRFGRYKAPVAATTVLAK